MESYSGYEAFHTNSSTAYESSLDIHVDKLSNRVSKLKVVSPQQLIHRDCYISNALTQIIIGRYKIKTNLQSVLLSRLGKTDCKSCSNYLVDTCLVFLSNFEKFSDKLNLPLQIISIIGHKDSLKRIENILSKFTNDDLTCLYWKILFGFSLPDKNIYIIKNSLLLNHYNFTVNVKHKTLFDKLALAPNHSLWVRTFNSIHKTYNYGLFSNNNNNNKYIEPIINYKDNPRTIYIINGLYTVISHSIIKYLSQNPCKNYFNIRNLINGLTILIIKFGNTFLKYRIKLTILICNKMFRAIKCNCRYIKNCYCVSGDSLKSDLIKLIKILSMIIPKNYYLYKILKNLNYSDKLSPHLIGTTFSDLNNNLSKLLDFYVNNPHLYTTQVLSLIKLGIQNMESLTDIKNCINIANNINVINRTSEFDELILKLTEKYNSLNDRADIYLTLNCDSLFDSDGRLKLWVISSESCDCPGE